MVLGGHGDTMVPLVSYTTVSGIPVTQLMDRATLDRIVDRTRNGGAEIVQYLKTGSAYYAPSAGAVQMAEAIVRDKKRILPCSAWLQGEYGMRDLFLGVPCKLGRNGLEQIIEVELTDEERAALALAEAVARLADRSDPVPDEVFEEAAAHFDEPQLGALILSIAHVNLWNRVNATTHQVAGAY